MTPAEDDAARVPRDGAPAMSAPPGCDGTPVALDTPPEASEAGATEASATPGAPGEPGTDPDTGA